MGITAVTISAWAALTPIVGQRHRFSGDISKGRLAGGRHHFSMGPVGVTLEAKGSTNV